MDAYYVERVIEIFSGFQWTDAVDIFLLALALYGIFVSLKRVNSLYLISILAIISVGCLVAGLFGLSASRKLLEFSFFGFFVMLIFLYHAEIKRWVWQRNKLQAGGFSSLVHKGSYDETKNCVEGIVRAVQNLSKNETGALLVIVPNTIPNHIIESGVKMDAAVSSHLIETVFIPKSPLHDGAMLIAGTKVIAAGCFLPLTQKMSFPKEVGTRHRAGVGITETSDVVSIIVSEETGIISVAVDGKLERYVDSVKLREILENVFGIKDNLELYANKNTQTSRD